jgi:aspartyl-tRNA(Asn)/glutamyl-tRNA(Gln) amidotransferase subunit C
MSLSLDEVQHIALLARLAHKPLPASEAQAVQQKLNNIFGLIDQLKAQDTTGLAPLAHPVAFMDEVLSQRLRDDVVTESNQREANQANAPAVERGLFLVPQVIE